MSEPMGDEEFRTAMEGLVVHLGKEFESAKTARHRVAITVFAEIEGAGDQRDADAISEVIVRHLTRTGTILNLPMRDGRVRFLAVNSYESEMAMRAGAFRITPAFRNAVRSQEVGKPWEDPSTPTEDMEPLFKRKAE